MITDKLTRALPVAIVVLTLLTAGGCNCKQERDPVTGMWRDGDCFGMSNDRDYTTGGCLELYGPDGCIGPYRLGRPISSGGAPPEAAGGGTGTEGAAGMPAAAGGSFGLECTLPEFALDPACTGSSRECKPLGLPGPRRIP